MTDIADNPKVAAVIGRAADGWPEGHEKTRTTRLDGMRYRGVWLASRHAKARELEAMQAALDYFANEGMDLIFDLVLDLWCDSKMGACYTARVHTAEQGMADDLARRLSEAFAAMQNGHNGITVRGQNVEGTHEAFWDEPDPGDDGAGEISDQSENSGPTHPHDAA